jgi:hypothetical protein
MKTKSFITGSYQSWFYRNIALIVLLCVLLAGTSLGDSPWTIRENGVGPVRVGMTLSQLQAALHQKLEEDDESGSDNCFYVHEHGNKQTSFMIVDDHLVRIDVLEPGIKTASGIQVGDPETKLRQVYGTRIKVMGHQYIDTGHYLTVRSTDSHYGIRFETDKGKILTFYAGTYEAIQFVEGCL